MTRVSDDILRNWDLGSRLEWLVTNGLGGYGAGSLSGANTRRYHGLLTAALKPPVERTVLLSKLEEDLSIEDRVYSLSANKYPDVIQPQGYRYLSSFDTEPVPTFTFSLHEASVILRKRIWMAHGKNTVYVRYEVLTAPEPIKLTLSMFMAYKDYHTEQRKYDGFSGRTDDIGPARIAFTAFDGAQPVHVRLLPATSFQFVRSGVWYYNYEHEREQERGQDAFEDLYCPGAFTGFLDPGGVITLSATVENDEPDLPDDALAAEIRRRDGLIEDANLPSGADPVMRALVLASDQFVIPRSERVPRASIIAGYPWFTDWGRDTMISIRGLCLTTGRYETARDILVSFAGAARDGLIPNRFSDREAGAEFNTADATLWLFQAAHAYAAATGDWELLTKDLYMVLGGILDAHIKGTRYSIHVDYEDGLLYAGEPGVQLTWMDAKFGGHVVTPRIGKPVEIQALWYNALRVMAETAGRAGKLNEPFLALANRARSSFLEKFIRPDAASLLDVVDGPAGNEACIRPNQLLALALAFPILDPASKIASAILDTVETELATPRGLRTLSARDPAYIGRYGPGDQAVRDAAYHQGAVWPWPLGPFVNACRAVRGDTDTGLLLTQVSQMLCEYGVGSIAEIYDGDEPRRPNGCFAQAWSVAELLRVLAKR